MSSPPKKNNNLNEPPAASNLFFCDLRSQTLREGTWVISDEGFRMTLSSVSCGGTKWTSWCWSDCCRWSCWNCICDAGSCFICGPSGPCIIDFMAGWVGSKAEFSIPWLAEVAAVAAAAMLAVAKAFGIKWLWRGRFATADCGGGEVVLPGAKDVDPTPNRECPGGACAELLLAFRVWPWPWPPELGLICNCGCEGCFNKSRGDSL